MVDIYLYIIILFTDCYCKNNKNNIFRINDLMYMFNIIQYCVLLLLLLLLLAVQPAFGGLHCYDAPSTAALQRRSSDCDSTTEP